MSLTIRDVPAGQECFWNGETNGYVVRVERHARRSTFVEIVSEPLAGCRMQLKHGCPVEPMDLVEAEEGDRT